MRDIRLSLSHVAPGNCLIFAILLATSSAHAELVPTRKACDDAIAHARLSVAGLDPAGMSRRFAESDLVQAKSEGGNGEFDDCLDYAAKAEDEAHHPHHRLAKTARTNPTPKPGPTPRPERVPPARPTTNPPPKDGPVSAAPHH